MDSAIASHSAVPFEHGEGDDDYLLQASESYGTNHRHLQELHRLSAFQQVTTKLLPCKAVGSPTRMRTMTDVISLSWTKTNEDQLSAIVRKVKQRFTKGFLTEIA